MKIGKFNCGCVSLISGFDAVLVLPCGDHERQVGTTVMRDNDPVDATPDECRAAMAELHSAVRDAREAIPMNASDMGTTGLCKWVLAGPTMRSQGQRKRRALEIIARRHGDARKGAFRRALAASTTNRAQREWAMESITTSTRLVACS